MSIITVWLSDLKLGYCSQGWWLNRKFCCWEIGEECEDWKLWTSFVGVQWIVYVTMAVSLLTNIPEQRSLRDLSRGTGNDVSKTCSTGMVCVRVRVHRQELGAIRCRLGNFRDQVHFDRLRHQRVPERRYDGHQVCCAGEPDRSERCCDSRLTGTDLCTLAQPIAIASGLSVGKEGPSVHVASAIGHVVAGQFTRFKRSQGLLQDLLSQT